MGLVDDLDLTESRRLQLAAEASGATGFLLNSAPTASIAAPITRWKISSARGKSGHRLNEAVWVLDLLYCRGGRSGESTLECRGQKLHTILTQPARRKKREVLAG
jgi:protein ImuA